MKSSGFVLFEYDENEEIILSFIYPEASPELKTVIQETANVLVSSNNMSIFSSYKDDYLYLEASINTSRNSDVKLYGICLVAPDLHPAMYSAYAKILCQIWADKGNGTKVLRSFLASKANGVLTYEDNEFAEDQFEGNCYRHCSFDQFLDRCVQHIPTIWQALVCGKSVAVFSPDITVLQSCAVPILSLVVPGERNLLPLVLEQSAVQTEAADEVKLSVWCSCDSAVLQNRFDCAIDLSARNLKLSPAFAKEAGKSQLAEQLAEAISNATATEADLVDVMEEFNGQIVSMLTSIKERLGDLSPASIASVNLPADTKLILTSIAANGVFDL